ncbi:MAG: hypothetical protein Q8P50_14575 [Bacillota bacterium]|nr:hypothetical protein [Bacillota bacterium]
MAHLANMLSTDQCTEFVDETAGLVCELYIDPNCERVPGDEMVQVLNLLLASKQGRSALTRAVRHASAEVMQNATPDGPEKLRDLSALIAKASAFRY